MASPQRLRDLDTFAIGVLRVRRDWMAAELYEIMRNCFAQDPEGDMKARSAYRHFTAAIGKALQTTRS